MTAFLKNINYSPGRTQAKAIEKLNSYVWLKTANLHEKYGASFTSFIQSYEHGS